MLPIPARRPLAALAALASLASCAIRPSEVPLDEHMVVVSAVRLPARSWLPWYTRFADHVWIDVRTGGTWKRVEWNSHLNGVRVAETDDGRSDTRWGMETRVLAAFHGDDVEPMAEAVLATAPAFPFAGGYLAWPGPNSNTFVDWLARAVPGLRVDLPSTAVGKDYATWVRAGVSSTRTGVEFETMLLGAQVGLQEGVEAHALGLTVGVGLWPPSVKLPFLPPLPFGWARRGTVEE